MEPTYKVGDWITWQDKFCHSYTIEISQILEVISGPRNTYYVEVDGRKYPVYSEEIAGTPTRRKIINSLHKKGLIKSPTKEEFAIYLLEN